MLGIILSLLLQQPAGIHMAIVLPLIAVLAPPAHKGDDDGGGVGNCDDGGDGDGGDDYKDLLL